MTSTWPLSGIRVLDASRILAGPFCCQILADLGADVVKVERPDGGDDTRHWGPPFLPPVQGEGPVGPSAYYLSANRGKRSIALDLAHPTDRHVFDELLGRADVLVENFLPDTAEKLGLSNEQLSRRRPRLVSCSVSGFGRTGPLAGMPGYDLVIQAVSGLMSITGEQGGTPMKIGVAITDIITGLYAAISVLAGLQVKQRNGLGTQFDLALADCTLASLVNVAQATLLTGERPQRFGNAHPHIVPYEAFATADGFLVLAVGNDRQWKKFCAVIQQPDWAEDLRWNTNPQRVIHREQLIPQLGILFLSRSTSEWQALLTQGEIPHAPVVPLDDVLKSPQIAARQMLETVTDAQGRQYSMLGSPIHWYGEPAHTVSAPPGLGEQTAGILRDWLDYSAEQIATFQSHSAQQNSKPAAS